MNLNICAGQLGSPAKRQEASQPQHSRSVRPTAGRMRQPFFNFAPTRKNARFSVLCQKSHQRLVVSFTVIMLLWKSHLLSEICLTVKSRNNTFTVQAPTWPSE